LTDLSPDTASGCEHRPWSIALLPRSGSRA